MDTVVFKERLPTNKLEDGGLFVTVAFSTVETKEILMPLYFVRKHKN